MRIAEYSLKRRQFREEIRTLKTQLEDLQNTGVSSVMESIDGGVFQKAFFIVMDLINWIPRGVKDFLILFFFMIFLSKNIPRTHPNKKRKRKLTSIIQGSKTLEITSVVSTSDSKDGIDDTSEISRAQSELSESKSGS